MDRHQKSLILIGAIGATIAFWIGTRSYNRSKYAMQKQKAFKLTIDINKDQKIDFERIKRQQKAQNVIFCGVKPTLNATTFNYIQRDVSNHDYTAGDKKNLKHMAGGTFQFKFTGNLLECDLRDATIFKSVMKQTKRPVQIFKNSNLDPLVSDITYNLKPFANMVLYGALSFDIQTQKFVLFPTFISSSLSEIQAYLQQKHMIRMLQVLIAGIFAIGLSYYLIWTPINNLLRRDKQKLKGANVSQLSFFKALNFFGSKNENKLKCIICTTNDSNMVFDCGHIQICQKCKQKQESIICSICNKKPKNFMKIFVS